MSGRRQSSMGGLHGCRLPRESIPDYPGRKEADNSYQNLFSQEVPEKRQWECGPAFQRQNM